jgi:hypothetical protein
MAAPRDLPPSAPSSTKVCFLDKKDGTQVTGSPFVFKGTISRSKRSYKVTFKHYPVWCVSSVKSGELAVRTGWKSEITGAPSDVTQGELDIAFRSVPGRFRNEDMIVRDSRNRIVATKFVSAEDPGKLVQLPGRSDERCYMCSWYGSVTGRRSLTGPMVFVNTSHMPGTFCVSPSLSWRETSPSTLSSVNDCPEYRTMLWSDLPKGRYKVEFTATLDGFAAKSTGKQYISVPLRP